MTGECEPRDVSTFHLQTFGGSRRSGDDVTGAAASPIRRMMTTSANFEFLPGANYAIPEFAVRMTRRRRRGFDFNYRFLVC